MYASFNPFFIALVLIYHFNSLVEQGWQGVRDCRRRGLAGQGVTVGGGVGGAKLN